MSKWLSFLEIKNDNQNINRFYEYIKDIDSNNNYGHMRNWELYRINSYLGNVDRRFLNNAYKRMQKDLEVIESEKSKELFLKNFTYGKLITNEFNKGDKWKSSV